MRDMTDPNLQSLPPRPSRMRRGAPAALGAGGVFGRVVGAVRPADALDPLVRVPLLRLPTGLVRLPGGRGGAVQCTASFPAAGAGGGGHRGGAGGGDGLRMGLPVRVPPGRAGEDSAAQVPHPLLDGLRALCRTGGPGGRGAVPMGRGAPAVHLSRLSGRGAGGGRAVDGPPGLCRRGGRVDERGEAGDPDRVLAGGRGDLSAVVRGAVSAGGLSGVVQSREPAAAAVRPAGVHGVQSVPLALRDGREGGPGRQ